MNVHVCALYRFVALADPASLQQPLRSAMQRHGVRGSLLVAPEGINGTIAGSREGIEAVLQMLARWPDLANIQGKWSRCEGMPFRKIRVRLKKEIVTIGTAEGDPAGFVGTYVDPQDWNALISRDDVTLIDTRNRYETEIGSFAGAIDPQTESFRDFPDYVETNLDPETHLSVAMYCTGGIRCEKATALLKRRGFKNVYHLSGGILRYLAEVNPDESLWRGDCFVFDERVAVDHDLRPSSHVMCHACGWAVSVDDQSHPDYRPGVHCPRCVDEITETQKRNFEMRQSQLDAAKAEAAKSP
ncbi:MAG: rhodanese-related sulfurtransferase [Planctomycetota bacterium]